MPRYFFNMINRERDEDSTGTTLADDRTAIREAVRFAGLALAAEPQLLTDNPRFAVELVNDRAQLIFTIDARASSPL